MIFDGRPTKADGKLYVNADEVALTATAEKLSIYKTVESKVKLPVVYRTRRCDMLSVPESTSFI